LWDRSFPHAGIRFHDAGSRLSNDTTQPFTMSLQENLGAQRRLSFIREQQSENELSITMAPSSSPEGLLLIKGYRVGRCIGSGAQADVHLLEPTPKAKNASSSTLPTYAVKLAPVPSKTTKKGVSVPEINERSINKEYLMYQNHMPKLRDAGMMASMPYTGGVIPHGTKDGMYLVTVSRLNESVLHPPSCLSSLTMHAHLLLLLYSYFTL
jgi:hypothetical protein